MPADSLAAPDEAIAIVGIAGLFPGSENLAEFWDNICRGVDSTTDVPEGRWLLGPAEAFDPQVGLADHVYSTRGGFVANERFDPAGLEIDGIRASELDPVFQLALHVARAAWRDARTDRVNSRRAGVIFGNIVLPVESAAGWSREVLASSFEEQMGLSSKAPRAVEPLNVFPAGLPAALVARTLGLGGLAYTLDAACATSLYALALAAGELHAGRADAMLCGGVSRPDALYIQMGFSQLRALSARGRPSPFDESADGLVAGEGAGMFVLKRLADALDHGDRIYGLLAGVGLSNDSRGDLLAPSTEGQLRAMRLAYQKAGWKPPDVDLIECHATGAPVGDSVEVESLKALWGDSGSTGPGCAIGSVKSNIGHALTAAGAAGLLKVLLALKNRVLPPTANFSQASPKLGLRASPFRVLTRPEPWPERTGGKPRRAAVSGFGFGGINAHVLIEEWVAQPAGPRGARTATRSGGIEARPDRAARPVAIVGVAAHFGPFDGLPLFRRRVLHGDRQATPAPPRGWWGISQTAWFRGQKWDGRKFPGFFIEDLKFRVDQFRIPPKELGEMLPQQSLMLEVAAEALRDARWDEKRALATGVLIGIGLDLNTTNYHLRWSLAGQARRWNQTLGLGLAQGDLEAWIDELKNAAGPALTANRTTGSLGGMVASRIAREFHIGGPSFTVSCDETSGIQALAIAADWLARGELDSAVVGAVDLAGDLRAVLARHQMLVRSGEAAVGMLGRDLFDDASGPSACDGAVALVLKRLDDALRDGDRVYAVLRGVDGGLDRMDRGGHGRLDVGYLDIQSACPLAPGDDRGLRGLTEACAGRGSGVTYALGSLAGDLGPCGAAAGLAAVAKAALCIDEQTIPGLAPTSGSKRESAAIPDSVFLPEGRQFWVRNRADGPRRAGVAASNLGGDCRFVILEEFEEESPRSWAGSAIRDSHPTGSGLALFAIEAGDQAGLIARMRKLTDLARDDSTNEIENLARAWWTANGNDARQRHGVAVVADGVESLLRLLGEAQQRVVDGCHDEPKRADDLNRIYQSSSLAATPGRMAFVYPGLGNQYPGMGRELGMLWPEVLRGQDAENQFLRDQLDPRVWWASKAPHAFNGHLEPILGSVSVACLVTDLLRGVGLAPDAAIGYSLGETAALVALRAWSARDEMLHRLRSSPLFHTELAGPCDAARRVWGIPPGEPVDWVAGIVPRSPEEVREAIAHSKRIEILIKNTANETVIGGSRKSLEHVVAVLKCPFFEVSTVSTVHCSIGREVESDYRALHDVPTHAPGGITFYSGVWGRSYAVDRQSAAAAIAAQASATIDFPRMIERAYQDGVRVFVDVGPGSSCTRLIGQILRQQPHLAVSACQAEGDPRMGILNVLGLLVAQRVPVDLAGLFGSNLVRDPVRIASPESIASNRHVIQVEVRGSGFRVPSLPAPATTPLAASVTEAILEAPEPVPGISLRGTREQGGPLHHGPAERLPLWRSILDAESAAAGAHDAFLKVAQDSADLIAKHLAFELELIEEWKRRSAAPGFRAMSSAGPIEPPVVFDRKACQEFAVGSASAVLGIDYAVVDRFPTRVRLPDEPLMLVDRVVAIEGAPRSLHGGRIVTEHVVKPQAWYLDGGRIVPSIAIEAGQADLLLCGYLGVDFETRGLAVYRLLDATVTFFGALPREGDVIRYDIRIDGFFRQGSMILFRFRLDATVAGEPFLSMRDGCAGFFTPEELAAGRGIIPHAIELHSRAEHSEERIPDLVPMSCTTLEQSQLEALRRGDLPGAFGPAFDRCLAGDPLPLPGGRLALLHRVTSLDATAGAPRLGFIRAEADIHPDDWFLVCHFIDDRVMPGTLMYESCLQALRILLMRMGWIGRRGQVAFEPVPGTPIRLKCRGQVVESTSAVTYEVTIKERGYRPEPYAIADALVIVDGKPIVELNGISLQLTGTNRAELETLWICSAGELAVVLPRADFERATKPATSGGVFFDHDRILAFALGKPAQAFGERYRPFEDGRFLARLPAPPFQCVDRIIKTDARPWIMSAGTSAVAEYDIDPEAWYFEAARQDSLPLAILLEVALQPCGWLAAYMGSALNSDEDLCFRNLSGSACQHRRVTRHTGMLTTRVKATKITSAAGMILQSYEFAVHSAEGPVYDGTADFGFFPPRAMEDQAGIRDATVYHMGEHESSRGRSFVFPDQPPFPDSRWRMIDQVDELVAGGGPDGLGVARGSVQVDPSAWFFRAHFMNDPVWPGSLGLESLLQLLKVMAVARWGAAPGPAFESPIPGQTHRWTYRGQILPTDHRVTVQAEIKSRDDQLRRLIADGHLEVDGKIIYRMHDFAIGLAES